jgi:hypothetical protein
VLTLTLGLGLGTAAFSLIDGVLLRPLPYPSADRLLLLKATVPPEGRDTVEITYADAHDIASGTDVFDGLAALIPYAGATTITDPPSRIEGFEVSPPSSRRSAWSRVSGARLRLETASLAALQS